MQLFTLFLLLEYTKNDVRKLCNQSFLTSYFGLRDSHGVGGNTIWDQDGCVEWQVA